MGTGQFNVEGGGGNPAIASHVVVSCYRNQDKLQPDGNLALMCTSPVRYRILVYVGSLKSIQEFGVALTLLSSSPNFLLTCTIL